MKVGNEMPHKDVHDLLSNQISKITKSSLELFKVSRLWAELLIPLFDLPLHWFLGGLRRWMHSGVKISSSPQCKCANQYCGCL